MAASFFKSVSFALNGLKRAWQERNFKIHIVIAIITIIFGFIFKLQAIEWAVVLICIASVLSLEIINTAIEHLVNLIEPNYNPKAGVIKDLAAGAVLVFSIISVIIGIMIFGKYALDLL
jgi:diacylglycerol kinase